MLYSLGRKSEATIIGCGIRCKELVSGALVPTSQDCDGVVAEDSVHANNNI